MPDTIPDLWPADLPPRIEDVPPVTILKRQAALLADKTKGVIGATVERSRSGDPQQEFIYDFFLTAPALGGYRYHLFYIQHGISLYPVSIGVPDRIVVSAGSEEIFLEAIRDLLSEERTRKVIASLWAQSKAS